MMQEVEVLKTIQELICSFFSEEQFTLSIIGKCLCRRKNPAIMGILMICMETYIAICFYPLHH